MEFGRTSWTLGVAIGAHAVCALALGFEHRLSPHENVASQSQGEFITLTEEPLESELPPLSSPPAEEAPRGALAAAIQPTRGVDDRLPRAGAPRIEGALAPPSSSPEPASRAWSMPIAQTSLDVGSSWKDVVLATDARPSAPATATRILREGLADCDRDLGLAPSGPLLSAAHEATSPNVAPDVGDAILEIDTDAAGKVVAARVLSATADSRSWEPVASEVVRLMAPKTLRVAAGARGLRTQLRIVAERRLPSGDNGVTTPGAVPDDVPGSPDPRMCDGTGPTRRCKAGMPVGFTRNFTDVTNAGARTTRLVAVRLLSELAL